jgi:hypothetical protein
MISKKLFFFTLILLLTLIIVSVNLENVVLFIVAFLIYLTLFILKVVQFYKQKKAKDKTSFTRSVLSIMLFASIFGFFIFMKDVFIMKSNAHSGLRKTTNTNKDEIERNGGDFKYDEYMLQLNASANLFSKEVDSIKFENKYYTYFAINYQPKKFKRKIMIIASVHGDEPAGALTIPLLLNDITSNPSFYEGTALYIICPINPVGLAFTSRENGNGCNINRDFELQTQKETKNIIKAIQIQHPDLILDIHENHGEFKTCLLANHIVGDNFGELICKQLTNASVELTSEPVGISNDVLSPNGWSKQGLYERLVKYTAGYGDLRGYGNSINLPVIALECDQSLSIEKRKSICLNTIKAAINNIKQLN